VDACAIRFLENVMHERLAAFPARHLTDAHAAFGAAVKSHDLASLIDGASFEFTPSQEMRPGVRVGTGRYSISSSARSREPLGFKARTL